MRTELPVYNLKMGVGNAITCLLYIFVPLQSSVTSLLIAHFEKDNAGLNESVT